MKKTTILLSILLGLPLASHAADNVVLYGQVNAGLTVFDNGKATNVTVDNLWTSSRIGFKGEEDLGGGLKALYQVETHVFPDNAATVGFGSREAWVGFSGDFGKFRLGRGTTPYAALADIANPFDGSDPLNMRMISKDGISAGRFNDSLRYDSPNLSGLTFSAQWGMGENKTAGNSASNNIALAGRYTIGTATLGAGFSRQAKLGGVSAKDNTAWLLGGSVKLDALELALAYQHGKKEDPANAAYREQTRNTVSASGLYTMGNTLLMAGLMFGDELENDSKSVNDSDYLRFTVGVHHRLSKRTKLIAEYVGDENKGGVADASQLTLGLMHSF